MRRSNRHGELANNGECWTLSALRTLQEHTDVMCVIYKDLRPMGKGLLKLTLVISGCFAGLDVLEQVVIALLM